MKINPHRNAVNRRAHFEPLKRQFSSKNNSGNSILVEDYAIYPPLGIARMGEDHKNNKKNLFFPECSDDNYHNFKHSYTLRKNRSQKIAQKFFVGAANFDGSFTRYNSDEYYIKWTVKVANTDTISKRIKTPTLEQKNNLSKRKNNFSINYQQEFKNVSAVFSVDNIVGGKRRVDIIGEGTLTEFGRNRLKSSINYNVAKVKFGTIECKSNGTMIFYPFDGIKNKKKYSYNDTNFRSLYNGYNNMCDGQITAELIPKDGGLSVKIESADKASWIISLPQNGSLTQPFVSIHDMMLQASNYKIPKYVQFGQIFNFIYRFYELDKESFCSSGEYRIVGGIYKIMSKYGNILPLLDPSEKNFQNRFEVYKELKNFVRKNIKNFSLNSRNNIIRNKTGYYDKLFLDELHSNEELKEKSRDACNTFNDIYLNTMLERYKHGKFFVSKGLLRSMDAYTSIDDVADFLCSEINEFSNKYKVVKYFGWYTYDTLYLEIPNIINNLDYPFKKKEVYLKNKQMYDFSPIGPITEIRINVTCEKNKKDITCKNSYMIEDLENQYNQTNQCYVTPGYFTDSLKKIYADL